VVSEIRRLTTRDVVELKQLLKACWLDTYTGSLPDRTIRTVLELWQSEENLFRGVQNPQLYYAGYFDTSSMLGMVSCGKVDQDTLRIYRHYVSPSSQRRGIGSRPMDDAVEHFKPLKQVVLDVEEGNKKGINFYKRYGFAFPAKTVIKVGDDEIPSLIAELELQE